MSLEISGTDWSFSLSWSSPPPEEAISGDAGEGQPLDLHLIISGPQWNYHLDAETNQWVRMWERFIEDEDRHHGKMSDRTVVAYGPSGAGISLKVRKKT